MFGLFRRKVRANPQSALEESAEVLDLLGRADAFREDAEPGRAAPLYLQALKADPRSLHALYWLATMSEDAGDLPSAKQYCELGLAIDADQVGLLLRFGSVAAKGLDPIFAVKCFERVAQIAPELPDLDAPMADQYCLMGRIEDGVSAFDRAIAKHPDNIALQNNRLFVLNYSKLLTPAKLFEEHRNWGRFHESRLGPPVENESISRAPEKRLRVGYVSPDLRDHAVAAFFEPLLRAHDRISFEIYCFDTSSDKEDVVTDRLRESADVWLHVAHLDDQQLAEAIRKCQIDVLVDLSGHTRGNRLLMFALKPAPVQVTWLGYLNTTGLSTMDYRFTDAYLDPPGETEQFHTETLWRLRHHSCFMPSPQSPAVGPLPASTNGYATFGSMNQWPKVSDEVKDVWASLLKRVDRSRLLIVARGSQNHVFRDRIVGEFTARGIDAGRIRVSPSLDFLKFLELFNEIDVSLDPFPYGGGTTTMQSLWMGVPVITLRGATALARNSVGILSEAGLPELVASSPSGYVTAAYELARDLGRLSRIRATLRETMANSCLTDARNFAANVESAYRSMWKKYCGPQVQI